MRKLIFLLLFLPVCLFGQVVQTSVSYSHVAGSSYCAEYQAVYNAMTNKPTGAIAANQNTFVSGRVTSGVWAKLKIFYGFAQYSNSAGEAQINWVAPGTYNATLSAHAPDFTSLEGFAGDVGNSAYINTTWIPNADSTPYKRNSASIGIYIMEYANEASYVYGSQDNISGGIIMSPRNSGVYTQRINSFANLDVVYAGGSGFYISNRTGTSAQEGFRNKVSIGSNTGVSNGLTTLALFVMARNYLGTADAFTAHKVACFFVGGGLTTDDINDITDGWEAYMDSNSKGVIP